MSNADAQESFDASDLESRLSEMRSKARADPTNPQSKSRPRQAKPSHPNISTPERRTRSPSAIPHSTPRPKAPEPSANQSTMLPTLLPDEPHKATIASPQRPTAQAQVGSSTTQSESQGHANGDSNITTLSKLSAIPDDAIGEASSIHNSIEDKGKQPLLGPDAGHEWELALPMGGSQRDRYIIRIKHQMEIAKSLLPAFVENPNNGTKDTVLKLLDTLHDILLHVDLEHQDLYSQDHGTDEMYANWAKTCCVKFKFLWDLVEKLRDSAVKIAVFVKGGLPYTIVTTFFKGREVTTYSSLDGSEPVFVGEGPFTVRVFSTESPPTTLPPNLSAVIGLDHTFHPGFMKSHFGGSNEADVITIPPSLRLLIANSLEQFERWLPQGMEETERLQTLVQAICQFKKECGVVPNGYPRSLASDPKALVAAQLTALVADVAVFMQYPESGVTWPTLEMLPQFETAFNTQRSVMEESEQQSKSSLSLKRRVVSRQSLNFWKMSNEKPGLC